MDPYIERRLRHYKTIGVRQIRAQASGRSDECELCKARHGVSYDIDAVPEFPPRGCTCPVGCGCSVSHVPQDGVLQVAFREYDDQRTETPPVAAATSPLAVATPPDLGLMAQEGWSHFASGTRLMLSGSGQLLRAFALWTARTLARGAAHCIHFLATTLPAWAKQTWIGTKHTTRRVGKTLNTWASETLTARPAASIPREAVKVKVEG